MKYRITKIACLSVSLLLFAVSGLFAGDAGSVITYGKDLSFRVSAPPGWVLDNQSGQKQGLLAALYPVGSNWSSATVVMYVNAASKTGDPTLASLINGDFARQKEQSPGLKMESGKPLPIADGTEVQVNNFTGDKSGSYESVAYVEAPNTYIMLVLTSRNKAEYDNAKGAFSQLVKSCVLK